MQVDELERELAPLMSALQHADWRAACDASEANEAAVVVAATALDAALASPDRYRALRLADDGADRRIHLLRLAFEAHQREPALARAVISAEASLATLFSLHRGSIRGKTVDENAVEEILRTSTDAAERRSAWEASKSIGPLVDPELRELAKLRNQAARALGYRDHFAFSLACEELDEAWLFDLLDRLARELASAWENEKVAIDAEQALRLGLPVGAVLRPWDYTDPFFQETPPLAHDALGEALLGVDPVAAAVAYMRALGEDVAGVIAASDLFPREHKNQHAFCTDLDRAGDVRVLANCVPGLRWLGTMVHELGHAIYQLAIDRELPWTMRSYAHLLTTEAIAMLHGRRVRDAAFLTRFCGLDGSLADPSIARRDLLIFAAWVQTMTRFEQELYRDPDQDLGSLWWTLVERYQRVAPPDGPRPHDWACKIHLSTAPVYYHNYLLGELTASQLEWALARECGSASPAAAPEAAGRFLRDRFASLGSTLRWDELIEHATGEPLDTRHLVEMLT